MRALQRETGVAGQRTADLRERLNFQCFKYELLVDMVRALSDTMTTLPPCPACQSSCNLSLMRSPSPTPAVKHAHGVRALNMTGCRRGGLQDSMLLISGSRVC